ncbi:PREDICTED: uncharacterized protein LOC109589006 [Amphimedon queenslandica]|uniref:Uncharacterized protein n=1 Tax=Amphimedon queenslandica TaxID=400682 RepID=A0AAN0JUW0_AMPQE|nr:PREDICTED: uncharacterized protein LOC109589006 [Amphimedon queenslandica]|eukprot:XP_019860687.1 PREDICTED: uncharacterized protein LOC109589006 [Amphimedon queenslandica]
MVETVILMDHFFGIGLTATTEGWYKCCLPTDCSDSNTSIIFANIFRWGEIADITVNFPSNITVLPQSYTLHGITIGDPNQGLLNEDTWYYESGSASTEITADLCTGQSGYSCTIGNGVLLHSSNGSYVYTLTVTWNGETITSGMLSQSNNNGDHVFRFYLHFGDAMRNQYITITAPAAAPHSLTVVGKTATTITVST